MADDSSSTGSKFSFYLYDPSLPLAIVFSILFAISSVYHTWLLVRRKTWYFIPFVLGCICETVGYIGRILASQETPDFTLTVYMVQALCILLAPVLFAASVYMVLGRIIRRCGAEKLSPVRVNWLTKIFLTADVICLLLQGGGGALLAQADGDQDKTTMGENLIIGGLFVQLTAFSLFIIATTVFHWRLLRSPTEASLARDVPWRRFLYVLYSVSLLILVRSIFRAIEYIQGYDGELQSEEYWLYIFDAALMLASVLILNIWHPSAIIAGRGQVGEPAKYDSAGSVGSGIELRGAPDDIESKPGTAGSSAYRQQEYQGNQQ